MAVPVTDSWVDAFERDGFTMFAEVFDSAEVADLARELQQAMAEPSDATAIRSRADTVYAARNILQLWPSAATLWRKPVLLAALEQVLGKEFGLVRGLYFDKPPERTWALPWHKDLTIAVREHLPDSAPFAKPTRKAGIPHVEASQELLEQMVTLRIHFDDVTSGNGPLRVIPGSHHIGKSMAIDESTARHMLCQAGDVLLIRPLVAHSSAASHPENISHRRILHLEFAARETLPSGFAWHTFLPGDPK